MSKISIDPKIDGIHSRKSVHNEMRKLVTVIRHESASLYVISVLTENILFFMFPTLCNVSFLFNLC